LRLELRDAAKKGAGRFVDPEWEGELGKPRQALGQPIDGVVAPRQRAMAAFVGDLEREVPANMPKLRCR